MLNSDEAFDLIEKIAELKGYSKATLVCEDLIPYFLAAYDPYKKYYITTDSKGKGTAVFTSETWSLLDKLQKRVISGDAAAFMLQKHITSLTDKSAILLARILKKDLRMGMGAKTINKVLGPVIPAHNVMLAKIFDSKRIKFPCWGSPKLDGVRAIYRDGKFYSRNGHEYSGLNILQKELAHEKVAIDGELLIPDLTFQESSGKIRSYAITPDAVFYPFDFPEDKRSFAKRVETLKSFVSNEYPHIIPVHHVILNKLDELSVYYGVCLDLGYEGAVIKSWDYKYTGSRSYHWMKMKPVHTVDLLVIDLFEGTGKYEGKLGGVICKFGEGTVKVGSGFSDAEREVWYPHRGLVGTWIEVDFMEKTDGDKSLRHPRYIRRRLDLS